MSKSFLPQMLVKAIKLIRRFLGSEQKEGFQTRKAGSWFLVSGVLIIVTLACLTNTPAAGVPAPRPTRTPLSTFTATPIPPSPTPRPTDTNTPITTDTPTPTLTPTFTDTPVPPVDTPVPTEAPPTNTPVPTPIPPTYTPLPTPPPYGDPCTNPASSITFADPYEYPCPHFATWQI